MPRLPVGAGGDPGVILVFYPAAAETAAAAARMGFTVLRWDPRWGTDYDVTAPAVRRRILGWARGGSLRGWIASIPRGTLMPSVTTAAAHDPLRSADKPWGVSGLSPAAASRTHLINRVISFFLTLAGASYALRIPFLIENPARSALWSFSAVRDLVRRPGMAWSVISSCSTGTAWRRDVAFMTHGLDVSHLSAMHCSASRRGLCLFSHRRHLPLAAACVTPSWSPRIATIVVRMFYNREVATIAANFERHTMAG